MMNVLCFLFFVDYFQAGLHVIPAINKIDMKNAQTKSVLKQIEDTFGLPKEKTLLVST